MALFRIVPDNTRIQFMNGRIAGLLTSAFLSIASVILFFHPGLNYGVDFRGGIMVELKTPGPADFGKLRTSIEGLSVGPVQLQQFGSPDEVLIRLQRQTGGDDAQQEAVNRIKSDIATNFAGAEVRRVEAVGATVSDELFEQGMLALGLALCAMLIYIWFRFEWEFGVGAVVTLLLDVTKTIGFFAITQMQFNLTSIAAILTIMGYSINDKVVVYDRMRENLRKYKTMPLRQLIDLSINETLNRTIGVSTATFLSALPLALMASEDLREFALVMLFGIVVSTTSSIFIAAPILLFLGEGRLRKSGITQAPAVPKPAK